MLPPYRSKIPEYLLGSRHVRKEHAIAQPVEGHPQRREPLGGGAVDGGDAQMFGEPVLGGQAKALSAQLVVIRQVGPALAGAPSGDVVRKQPGEPETVVAEVRAKQKGPVPGVVEAPEGPHHVDQGVVSAGVRGAGWGGAATD